MTTLYTNNEGISLSLALWLATDDYDHSEDPNEISTTTLLKPIRQIVLARQSKELVKVADVAGLVASRLGTAIHDAIESSWTDQQKAIITLIALGYPKKVAERIRINPTAEVLAADSNIIPVYMEIRSKKKVNGWVVTGKFDFVAERQLTDFKSTGTYGYMNASNIVKYSEQGSIYRWLRPDLITNDVMKIELIFTDWSSMQAKQNRDYPQSRLHTLPVELMSIEDTDTFVTDKLTQITQLMGATSEQLPECTDEELWKKPDAFKYYNAKAKVEKKRATKNYDTMSDAIAHKTKDGNTGEIVSYPGKVMRCNYCDVVEVCSQAAGLIEAGLLTKR